MAKPDPTAIAAAVPVAAATPIYGEYALIVLAALFGSLVALSRMTGKPRGESALFIFRGVAFASFAAGACASWLSARTGVEFHRVLGLMAFVIAYIGDDWSKLKELAIDRWVKK